MVGDHGEWALCNGKNCRYKDEGAQVDSEKERQKAGVCGPWTQSLVEKKSRNFARKKKVQNHEPQTVAVAVAYVRPASGSRAAASRGAPGIPPLIHQRTPSTMEGLFFNTNGG